MQELKGKNAILTGASRGIGVSIARELARRGVNLALVARPTSLGELEQVAQEARQYGVCAWSIAADVSQAQARVQLVQAAQERLGSIDILINNAGVEHLGPFVEINEALTRFTTEVNLLAPIELVRLVLPGMIQRRTGQIIQVASMSGKVPVTYDAIYLATKAGLIAWTWAVRDELAEKGIQISVVCPGYISEVGMHARDGLRAPGIAREVSPEKVARKVISTLINHRLEVLVLAGPVRPLLAIKELSPELTRWAYRLLGIDAFWRKKMESQRPKSPQP